LRLASQRLDAVSVGGVWRVVPWNYGVSATRTREKVLCQKKTLLSKYFFSVMISAGYETDFT
jgi:hypothetical protein